MVLSPSTTGGNICSAMERNRFNKTLKVEISVLQSNMVSPIYLRKQMQCNQLET